MCSCRSCAFSTKTKHPVLTPTANLEPSEPIFDPKILDPRSDPNEAFPPNQTSAVWVEVAVPSDAAPGDYEGSVAVLAAGEVIVRVPVSLTVWDFSVAQRSLRPVFAIQKGTRVLVSLWDSLMFGRVLKSTTIF